MKYTEELIDKDLLLMALDRARKQCINEINIIHMHGGKPNQTKEDLEVIEEAIEQVPGLMRKLKQLQVDCLRYFHQANPEQMGR